MRSYTRIVAMALLVLSLASVQAADQPGNLAVAPPAGLQENHCSDCHSCTNPTEEDPCLAPCPRNLPEKGPDVVLINQLSAQYVPVVFAHKLHAQMTEMTGGCTLCHHFNPSRRIRRCQECHTASSGEDLAKPGLKGAYHRQCLNCHREWSHETECAVCHAKKTADSLPVMAPDPTDIMGILHPNAEEPVIRTYETAYEEGKLVTFRHQDHVQRYGFKCVSCHREANCSSCHDPETAQMRPKTFKEHHAPCTICHETSEAKPANCSHCHSDQQTPPFAHAKTGLVLSEDHDIAACGDCHVGSKFREKPTCSECHDEEITYPEKLPGTRLEMP